MSKTGRHFVYDLNGRLKRVVEPISTAPDRNADWTRGVSNLPIGGSITEAESIITEEHFSITYKP